MTYGVEVGLLRLIDDAVTHGFMRTAREYVDQWGTALSKSRTEGIRSDYAELLKRVDTALEIERQHGDGAALNLDHPFVQKLIASPRGYFSPDQVAAARRYRASLKDQTP